MLLIMFQIAANFENVDSTITIQQLLCHKGGVDNWWTLAFTDSMVDNPTRVWTPEEILDQIGSPLFDH